MRLPPVTRRAGLRAAVVLLLLSGAAGSVASLVRHRDVLPSLLAATDSAGWGYATLEPAALFVRDRLPAAARVTVLSPTDAPFLWLRYLAYPRPVRWVPTDVGADRLASLLPPGESWLIFAQAPGARDDGRFAAVLAERLPHARIERIFDDPAGAPVYRIQR